MKKTTTTKKKGTRVTTSAPPPPSEDPPPPPRSKIVAAILALVAPGLGHVYVGHTIRGGIWAFVPVVIVIVFLTVTHEASPLAIFSVLGGSAFIAYVGGAADVIVMSSRKYRQGSPLVMIGFGIVAFIAAPVLGGVTRALVLEAYKVPSGAMVPTVMVGDHLFVDKSVYRKRAPHRGEVMVFEYPEHRTQSFIKRVVTVPGDRLEVRKGRPIINGWEVPSCRVGTYRYADSSDESVRHEGTLYVEFLEASAYLVLFDTASFETEYQGPFHAASDEFWVLGDNRNNSHDSRMWNGGVGGGVPYSHIKGRARTVWMNPIVSGRSGVDLSAEPVSPSPDLDAALKACLANRPTIAAATPPSPR